MSDPKERAKEAALADLNIAAWDYARQQAGVSAEQVAKLVEKWRKRAYELDKEMGVHGDDVNLCASELEALLATAPPEQDNGVAQEEAQLLARYDKALQAQPQATSAGALTFEEFSRINRQRCESKEGFNHALSSWSMSDWFTALMGELGEAANIAKKLNRVRDGIPGNKSSKEELQAKLRQELGDVFVYLDLLAQSEGFFIGNAAMEVFNAKSQELKCPILITALAAHDQKVRAEVLEQAVQAIIDAEMIVKADEPRAIEAIRSLAVAVENK